MESFSSVQPQAQGPAPEAGGVVSSKKSRFSVFKTEFPRALRQIQAVFQEMLKLPKFAPCNRSIVARVNPTDINAVEPRYPGLLNINGFIGKSGHLMYHIDYQKEKNDPWSKNIFSVDIGGPFQSIEDSAFAVHKQVVKMKALGFTEIVIVAHSMGGLVAEAYKELFAQQDGVKIVDTITIGSPLSGTWMALLAAVFSRQARQMLPTSSFSQSRTMEHVQNIPLKERVGQFEGVEKIITKSYQNEKGERVWEQKWVEQEVVYCAQRIWKENGIIEERRFEETVQGKPMVTPAELSYSDYEGSEEISRTVSHFDPQEQGRALHLGSKKDIVVNYKRSTSPPGGLKEGEKVAELDVSGHIGELTSAVAHKAVYERISKTMERYPLLKKI